MLYNSSQDFLKYENENLKKKIMELNSTISRLMLRKEKLDKVLSSQRLNRGKSGLGYSPLEIALAWVRDCPGVTSAVIGARTGAQLRGALSSENVNLPMPVREALDEISVE